MYFDNNKFINNIVSGLNLKLNDYYIYEDDKIYDLKIIIKGSVKTYYHPDQYIGYLYFYIFPTKIDYSIINLNIDIYYKGFELLKFQMNENLDIWGWLIPVMPFLPVDYNKSIANELSERVIKAFDLKNTTNKIKTIDDNIKNNNTKNEKDSSAKNFNSKNENMKIFRTGTGFLIGNKGFMLTNRHVVEGAVKLVVQIAGSDFNATVVSVDESSDIALIKVDLIQSASGLDLDLTPATLGQPVYTIGYPNPEIQGLSPKYTAGEISSLKGIADDVQYMQVSVPVQPGNSGGPLVTKDGKVIGIISAKLSDSKTYNTTGSLPQNVNYAVRISRALPLLLEAGIAEEIFLSKNNKNIEEVSNLVGLIGVLR